MTTLTLDDIQATLNKILTEPLPEPKGCVRDQHTESIGLIQDRLGTWLSEHGKLVNLIYVKVVEPKAHHKKGDFVIWRDPEQVGG